MPLYDIRCDDCGEMEDVSLPSSEVGDLMKCPRCGERMAHRTPMFQETVFRSFVHWNLGAEDVEITSKSQLKRECDSRGLISEYLD